MIVTNVKISASEWYSLAVFTGNGDECRKVESILNNRR
jgi:hypothetical protein